MAPSTIKHHALAIPLPAQGHINPLMRFCKKLAREGFTITFVDIDPVYYRLAQLKEEQEQAQMHLQNGLKGGEAKNNNEDDEKKVGQEEESKLENNGSMAGGGDEPIEMKHANGKEKLDIRRVHVPIDGLDLSQGFSVCLEHFLEAQKSVAPHVEDLLHHLILKDPPVTCLISDFYMTAATQRLAHNFNLPRIALFPSSQSLHLFYHYLYKGLLPKKAVLDVVMKKSKPTCDVFMEGLEGLPPTIRNHDVPHFKHVVDDNIYMFDFMDREMEECNNGAHAIVVNSFEELEAPSFRTLSSRVNVPIYGVGPLVEPLGEETTTNLWKEDENCMLWLDQQPPLSVLYVSFGSVTILSYPQFEEFLTGLICSQQRFLWVFRPGLVENTPHPLDPLELMSKTHGKGCFVDWAPQLQVLSHPSIGGFLTHCGWNSTIEAISHGVPMLCWPYFADQFLDAKYIVEEWKIGLRFMINEGCGLVEWLEVERVIRALMEGEEGKVLQRNATKLKEASCQSIRPSGSSYKNIQALIQSLS